MGEWALPGNRALTYLDRRDNIAGKGRVAFDGLRPYLQVLEQRGLMRWVDKEVDKDWEIGAVARMIFRATDEGNRYGIGFRNIKGFPGARVVAASREMIATAIGCEPDPAAIHDATRKWDYPDILLPPLEQMREVAADRESYGLPPLDELKPPREG